MTTRVSAAQQRRDELDALLGLILRYVIAFGGLVAFGFNLAFMYEQPPEVRIAALVGSFAMMGRVIAASVAEILRAWRAAK